MAAARKTGTMTARAKPNTPAKTMEEKPAKKSKTVQQHKTVPQKGEHCQSEGDSCCGDHSCGCCDDSQEMKKTLLAALGKKGTASDGRTVLVHYTGTLASGEVFDSSEGRDPLGFTMGEKQVVRGFENAVRGMKTGEKKMVTLSSLEAYGDHNPAMVQDVPLAVVKQAGITPQQGMMLLLRHPQEPTMQLPARIVEVTATTVKIDLNHPLAGKALTFAIEVVGVD